MKTTVALLLIYVFAELVVLANAMFIAVVLRPEDFPLLPLSLGVLLSVPGILLLRFCWHRRVLGYTGALVLGTVGLLIELVLFFRPGGGPSLPIAATYSVLPACVSLLSYRSLSELRKSSQTRPVSAG